MTYCVGIMLDTGLIFASDSRTHAEVDNFARFCKMTVFERAGDRVIVLLSSGNLAGTQAVISLLKQRGTPGTGCPIYGARSPCSMPRCWCRTQCGTSIGATASTWQTVISASTPRSYSAARSTGEPPRLFRIYAEGNFIEASLETPYLQTGETKYGKPIIDWVITRSTSLNDAAKCVLVSFDSTMRSNLSVGMPIDLICYKRDSLEVRMRRRFDEEDAYFSALGKQWSEGTRQVFSRLPNLDW